MNDAAVVLAGRLHPAAMVLSAARNLVRFAIPLAFLAVKAWTDDDASSSVTRAVLVFLGLFGVVVLPVKRYLSYRFELTTTDLRIIEGIFGKHERRIPLDRIQDLSEERTLLGRALGVVRVTVETAASAGQAEATIDGIAPDLARRLRAALSGLDQGAPAAQPGAPPPPLYRASPRDLALRGFTDNWAAPVAIGAAWLFDSAFDVGGDSVIEAIKRHVESTWQTSLVGVEPLWVALTVLAGAGLLLIGGAISAVTTMLRYHGFTLIDRGDVLQRQFGLLSMHVRSLPRSRIQVVKLQQSPARRLLGLGQLSASHAGSASTEGKQQEAGGMLAPAGRLGALESLAARVLPEAPIAGVAWQPTSKKIIRVHGTRGLLLGAALAAALAFFFGASPLHLLIVAGCAALGALAGRQASRVWAFAVEESHVAVRWGILGRYRAAIPYGAIQGLTSLATPFERLRRQAHIIVRVAGGDAVTIPNLDAPHAHRLLTELGHRAARHRPRLQMRSKLPTRSER